MEREAELRSKSRDRKAKLCFGNRERKAKALLRDAGTQSIALLRDTRKIRFPTRAYALYGMTKITKADATSAFSFAFQNPLRMFGTRSEASLRESGTQSIALLRDARKTRFPTRAYALYGITEISVRHRSSFYVPESVIRSRKAFPH
ncbi:hypothetical protein EGH82_13370 [Vibrio ponticus]|uniref:Uncharacterized protein n=1 Tax=Vibrio ponticus TaxID=265668 RepID=A0A3N3DYQ5_9VIBR|nr:hypothetical protein EGH82_13370 [Vibrio ponticus]